MLRPTVFLDRDGVINFNRPDHVKSWAEFAFLPGALTALQRLAQLAWPVVVISNQAAIGRGLVSRRIVDEINARMAAEIGRVGGRIDGVFYCPHRPEEECACRKPRPGLLVQAAQRMQLDLPRSFLVGDAESDVAAARAVGCRPVLVKTGRGAAHLTLLRQRNQTDFYVADSLGAAVSWIITQATLERLPA